VLGLSHIACVLAQVTKGGGKEKFAWGKEQQRPFDDFKHLLCTSDVLSLLDIQQPFEIDTDAYNYVVGALSLNMVIR
jgi:hypothetical protein